MVCTTKCSEKKTHYFFVAPDFNKIMWLTTTPSAVHLFQSGNLIFPQCHPFHFFMANPLRLVAFQAPFPSSLQCSSVLHCHNSLEAKPCMDTTHGHHKGSREATLTSTQERRCPTTREGSLLPLFFCLLTEDQLLFLGFTLIFSEGSQWVIKSAIIVNHFSHITDLRFCNGCQEEIKELVQNLCCFNVLGVCLMNTIIPYRKEHNFLLSKVSPIHLKLKQTDCMCLGESVT